MNTTSHARAPDPNGVSGSVREQRLQICKACPAAVKQKLTRVTVCSVCHCPLFTKVRASGARCPLGKW